MAKVSLTDLTSLSNGASAVATINANSSAIETAMEKTLSRDGTSPNQMEADLDMNSNQILNLPDATTDQEPVTLSQLNDVVDTLEEGASVTATYVTMTSNDGLLNERVLAGGTNISITDGGAGSSVTVNVSGDDLNAYESLSTTGLVARTGSGTVSTRTLTAPAAGITVSDGDGVAGNPTLVLANDLAAIEGLSTTGLVTRTGDGTATTRSVTGTANEITVTDGDGVSGAPTISLPTALTFTGKTVTGGTFDGITVSPSSTFADGSAAAPSIRFSDADSGLFGAADQVSISTGGAEHFNVKTVGGVNYVGSPEEQTGAFPEFTFEDGGRTKLRTRSIIIGDPGDTPEIGNYLAAGAPETGSYTPWPASSNGQQMALYYYTNLAADDDNPTNYILGDTYRTIKPFRLSGASPFAVTRYMPSISGYTNGMKIHVYWVANSPATPNININGWGNRELKTNAGASAGLNNWAAGAECTFEYFTGTADFRAVVQGSADSDSSAGRTDRNGFMNPSWGRGAGFKTRMSQATSETSRPLDFIIETSRLDESVLRERFSVSNIGNTVILGQGSYETAAAIDGIAREDYYPGPLDNLATDDMYSGNYFAGNVGQHNGFRTPGAGSLTVIAPDEAMNSTIAIRKASEYNKGLDISYHHAGDRLLLQGCATSGSTTNVTGTSSSGGLINITCSGAHGISRRDTVVVSGVGGTTEANGVWTAWPTSTTTLLLLGSIYANAWTAGGTVAKVTKTTYGTFKPDTGVWNFGGDVGASSLEVARASSQVNRLVVTGAVTAGNGPAVQVDGTDTNINLRLESKGTGSVALRPGSNLGLRVNGIASAVNFLEIDPATTGNYVLITGAGSDSNVGLNIRSKGSARLDFSPGGTNTVRMPVVASAVNYFELKGSATGVPVDIEAGGSDANVDLRIVPRGTGLVRFGTHTGTGDVACNGYITIRDFAGTQRRLMTTA